MRLLFLFILVPLVDMLLLTRVSAAIGFMNTLALVVVTGVLGAWLSKREGARAMQRWRQALARGELPEDGVVGSVLLLVGSVLLITPGVLTDALGLALLLGPSRRLLARLLRPRLSGWFHNRASGGGAAFRVVRFGGGPFGGSPFDDGVGHHRPAQPFAAATARGGRAADGCLHHRRAPRRVIDVDFDVTDEAD